MESAEIIPLADLHIGAEFDDKKFFSYRDYILSSENTYCVILGDTLDMVTRGSIGDLYEGLRPREQRKLAVKYLQPLADAGKILLYLDGNHEARATKETDEHPGEIICSMLGIPSAFDPDGAVMFLSIGYTRAEGAGNRNSYVMYMLHGHTGSRMVGGKANNLEAMAKSVTADCYIAAHTHTKIAFSRRMIVTNNTKKVCVWRKQLFVSTGSFLDWSGYAIRRGYNPATLGAPVITLSGTRHDLHASV